MNHLYLHAHKKGSNFLFRCNEGITAKQGRAIIEVFGQVVTEIREFLNNSARVSAQASKKIPEQIFDFSIKFLRNISKCADTHEYQ